MAEGLSSKHLVFPPGRKKTTLKSNDGSAQSCRLVPPSPFWSAEYAKVVAPIFFDSSAGFNKQFLDLCTTCERSVEHFLSIIHPAVGESPTKVCPTFAGTKVGHGFLIPTVRKTRLPEFVASPLLPPCPPFAKARVTPRYARPRGRSHYTVSVHTIHETSALTRSPHLEGSASSHRPRGATRGQEGDARVGSPPTH